MQMNAQTEQFAAPMLFGVFVALGVAFIITAKVQFSLSPWMTLSLPVLIMLGYALIVSLPGLRLRDDQTGDNLYYMGFLFTLTSLGVALYQFSSEGSAEQIVRAFGVAIASTIAGIAFRVLFAQMRRDPIEVERNARVELAEAARRVRRELDATVIELSNFRRHTIQTLDDGFRDVRANVDNISASLLKSLEETLDRSRNPLIDASKTSSELLGNMGQTTARKLDGFADTMTANLDKSAAALVTENARLAQSVSAMALTLDEMAKKLSDMQTPEKIIEVKLGPALQPIIEGAAAFARNAERAADAHAQQLAKAEAIQTNFAALAQNLLDLSARLKQNDRVLADFPNALNTLDQKLTNGFSDMKAVFDVSQNNLGNLVASIESGNKAIVSGLTSLANDLRDQQEATRAPRSIAAVEGTYEPSR